MDTACSDSDEIKGARNGVTSWPCILKPGFAQFVIMMVTAVNHRDSPPAASREAWQER